MSSTNGRVRRTVSEWQDLVRRYGESGRSRAAFYRAEGISTSSFGFWQRKLGSKKGTATKREFVELTPVAPIRREQERSVKHPRAQALAVAMVAALANPSFAGEPIDSCEVHWVLAALESRNASVDADSAIRRGGPQFVGLYGYSLEARA